MAGRQTGFPFKFFALRLTVHGVLLRHRPEIVFSEQIWTDMCLKSCCGDVAGLGSAPLPPLSLFVLKNKNKTTANCKPEIPFEPLGTYSTW